MPDGLDPLLDQKAQQLVNLARQEGIELRITTGYRSPAQQEKLYAQGRTAPGNIVTYAPPGRSRHQGGSAIDVAPFVEGQPDWNSPHWERIGQLGKSLDLEWGGDWQGKKRDRPHFQLATTTDQRAQPGAMAPPGRGTPDKATLARLIQLHALKAGVDPDLAVAVATQESSLDPTRRGDNGKSLGLFQLQEAAATDAGIDPQRRGEIAQNIRGGVAYLKQGLDRFGGDTRQALERHYNRGGDPDYYAHVMQYVPGHRRAASRPGLLARVSRALSPGVAEAAGPPGSAPAPGWTRGPEPAPTGTRTPQDRAALEQRLQQLKAERARMTGTPSPAAPETFPPLAEQEAAAQQQALSGLAPRDAVPPPPPTAATQVNLLADQEQQRLAAERAVGSPTVAPAENVKALGTMAAATGISMAGTAGGAKLGGLAGLPFGPMGVAVGAGLGGIAGSFTGRKANVALGLEEPGWGGDVLSVAIPGLQAGYGAVKAGLRGLVRSSRGWKAVTAADEANAAAQKTYSEGTQTAVEQTKAQRQAAVSSQQARETVYQDRLAQRRATAETRHQAQEASTAQRVTDLQAEAAQEAQAKTQTQAREYAEQVSRYDQAVASQSQAVGQAKAIPPRYTPETPAHVLYDKVAAIAPEAPVTLTRTQEVAAELQDVLEQVPSLQPSRMQALLTDLRAARSTQSLREVRQYLKDIGVLTGSKDSAIRSRGKQLFGALHDDLAESASRLPATEAGRDLLLQANASWRRELATRDVSRVISRAITVGDDGIPRLSPGRALTQFDRLVEEDRFFAGSFTPDDLTTLRSELSGLTTAQKIPPRPGAAPQPVQPRQVEPFTPTPFQPPAPPARRAPYSTWKPDVAAPTPPEPVLPTLPKRDVGALRELLRTFGIGTAAWTAGMNPIAQVALAFEAKDKLGDFLSKMIMNPRLRPAVQRILHADGSINKPALIALAGGRAAIMAERTKEREKGR